MTLPVPPARWCVLLTFEGSRDEAEDWSRLSQGLTWLHELPQQRRIVLGESLRETGLAVLPGLVPEEALRLAAGVGGDSLRVSIYDAEGSEVRPGVDLAQLRRRLGVHATPPALVSYVVRSVHRLLQSRLGHQAGLVDRRVRVLDPAAGPMNFLLEAWRVALEEHRGDVQGLLREHLLPNFKGTELFPPSWAAGRREVIRFLAAQGCGPAEPALELADSLAATVPRPYSVVLGNPPWSGFKPHRGSWIRQLLHGYTRPDGSFEEGYFRVAGEPLGERNPKWLQDDYVKFLRFAQWTIEHNGEGIVAFVVNHNCLDAPTFRGLRYSLLGTFEEIYALDLHGNRRRDEKDENVFPGVAQGTAVLLLVKSPGLRKRVLRADLEGTREGKLKALGTSDVTTTSWTEVRPRPPLYLFIRGDDQKEREYRRGVPLPDIFPIHSSGVVTGCDASAIAFEPEAFGEEGKGESFLMRPFDLRSILYRPDLLARPRWKVMRHLREGGNVALLSSRRWPHAGEVPGALVTGWLAGHKVLSRHDSNTVFPLFLLDGENGRTANLEPHLWDTLSDFYGERPTPEEVFGYVYAVLYDSSFRKRFGEQLRNGFPRIPFVPDASLFHGLSRLGGELVRLHLLDDSRLHDLADLSSEGVDPGILAYQVGSYRVVERWLRARTGRSLTSSERQALSRMVMALRLSMGTEETLRGLSPLKA